MSEQEQEIKVTLRVCLISCIVLGSICFVLFVLLLINYINHPHETPLMSMIISSFLLILFSSFFFLSIAIRKKKIVTTYYATIGFFIFLPHTTTAFASLFRIGSPSFEFIILATIACFGLWIFLAGINPTIRNSFKNLEKELETT